MDSYPPLKGLGTGTQAPVPEKQSGHPGSRTTRRSDPRELGFRLRLAWAKITPDNLRSLLRKGGDPEGIAKSLMGDPMAPGWMRGAIAIPSEQRMEQLLEAGTTPFWLGTEGYPPWLAAIPDPPDVLLVRGALSDRPGVAVVGSRNATRRGCGFPDRGGRGARRASDHGGNRPGGGRLLARGGGPRRGTRQMVLRFELTRKGVLRLADSRPENVVERGCRTLVLNRTRRNGIISTVTGVGSRWYPETLVRRIQEIGFNAERLVFCESDGQRLLEAVESAQWCSPTPRMNTRARDCIPTGRSITSGCSRPSPKAESSSSPPTTTRSG